MQSTCDPVSRDISFYPYLQQLYMPSQLVYWFKYDIELKYYAPQFQPDQLGFELMTPDHVSTFHVIEITPLTTRPSVTSHT